MGWGRSRMKHYPSDPPTTYQRPTGSPRTPSIEPDPPLSTHTHHNPRTHRISQPPLSHPNPTPKSTTALHDAPLPGLAALRGAPPLHEPRRRLLPRGTYLQFACVFICVCKRLDPPVVGPGKIVTTSNPTPTPRCPPITKRRSAPSWPRSWCPCWRARPPS